MKFQMAGATHCGLVRSNNEDAFLVVRDDSENAVLAAVADGIGGNDDGEIASLICCRELLKNWRSGGRIREKFLPDAIKAMNRKIFERNRLLRKRRPMGSTIAAAVFAGNTVFCANVGDSRIYELSPGGELRTLSEDHSQPVVRNGKKGFLLTRSVGTLPFAEAAVCSAECQTGSRYLFCTDGLFRNVNDDELKRILQAAATPRSALDRFFRKALLAGGEDNITAAVVFAD